MTCIAGLVHEGSVWIGGDSAAHYGGECEVRIEPKVFWNGPYLIGASGSVRADQLVECVFNPTAPARTLCGHALYRFMVSSFAKELRACLTEGEISFQEGSVSNGFSLLVGINGQLFGVYASFDVGEVSARYVGIGSGGVFATGALFATRKLNFHPQRRIELALEAATEHDCNVRPPYTILASK